MSQCFLGCRYRNFFRKRSSRQIKRGGRLCQMAARYALLRRASKSTHEAFDQGRALPLAGLAPSAPSSAGARFAHAHIAELTVRVRLGNTKREHSISCVPFLPTGHIRDITAFLGRIRTVTRLLLFLVIIIRSSLLLVNINLYSFVNP